MRWVESADPDLLKELSNQEIQQQEVLHELIATETDYVRTLNVVVDVRKISFISVVIHLY